MKLLKAFVGYICSLVFAIIVLPILCAEICFKENLWPWEIR